jgi:hypothetical protein
LDIKASLWPLPCVAGGAAGIEIQVAAKWPLTAIEALALWLFLPIRPRVGTNDAARGATYFCLWADA